MIKKLDHLVITTSHMASCIEFYEKLGFRGREAAGRWELFAGDFKVNVHAKGMELEPKAQNVQTGSADLCFEIDGAIEDCRDEVIAKGILPETGIVRRHGVRGEMRSIYLRDTDGNLIELCSYE